MEYGLSLGSNEGDRAGNLELAIKKINELEDVSCVQQSSIYETDPLDVHTEHNEKKFLNCVIIIKIALQPVELFQLLQDIEVDMGRPENHGVNLPRPIDIDIIYAGNSRFDSNELTIPHPRWSERRFVAEPLAELRPDMILLGTDIPVKDILKSIPKKPKVVLYKT